MLLLLIKFAPTSWAGAPSKQGFIYPPPTLGCVCVCVYPPPPFLQLHPPLPDTPMGGGVYKDTPHWSDQHPPNQKILYKNLPPRLAPGGHAPPPPLRPPPSLRHCLIPHFVDPPLHSSISPPAYTRRTTSPQPAGCCPWALALGCLSPFNSEII